MADDVLRALADPTRRAIFERVARGEATVSDLHAGLSVSQPAVSQHLAALRNAGLVQDRRAGRHVFYRARPEGLQPLIDWIGFYQGFWQQRIQDLITTLQEMDMTQVEAQTRSIDVEFDLPQPQTAVWRALTESHLIARWLMANDFQPVVGHHFTFHAQPVPGWDGTVNCEVLAVEPPMFLKYSWSGGSDDLVGYGHRLNTTVSWTLSPSAGGGTHVHLLHDGFTPADSTGYEMMGQGWRTNVAASLARVVSELA